MERLTREKQIGPFAALKDKAESAPGAFNTYDCFYAHAMAVTRLKQYEDTGLTPKEVSELVSPKVVEIARLLSNMFNEGSAQHMVELFEAEKDGRLVVLPCKVGDTVYMPVGKWNAITGYEEDKCDGFYIGKDGILQIKAQCYTGNHGTYGVPGKTVFLTRKEAESALKKREAEVHELKRLRLCRDAVRRLVLRLPKRHRPPSPLPTGGGLHGPCGGRPGLKTDMEGDQADEKPKLGHDKGPRPLRRGMA